MCVANRAEKAKAKTKGRGGKETAGPLSIWCLWLVVAPKRQDQSLTPCCHQCQEQWCHTWSREYEEFITYVLMLIGKNRAHIQVSLKWLDRSRENGFGFYCGYRQSRLHFLCMAKVCVVWTSLMAPWRELPGFLINLPNVGQKEKKHNRAYWISERIHLLEHYYNMFYKGLIWLENSSCIISYKYCQVFAWKWQSLFLSKCLPNTLVWITVVC